MQLNNDLIAEIASFLDLRSHALLAQVSKRCQMAMRLRSAWRSLRRLLVVHGRLYSLRQLQLRVKNLEVLDLKMCDEEHAEDTFRTSLSAGIANLGVISENKSLRHLRVFLSDHRPQLSVHQLAPLRRLKLRTLCIRDCDIGDAAALLPIMNCKLLHIVTRNREQLLPIMETFQAATKITVEEIVIGHLSRDRCQASRPPLLRLEPIQDYLSALCMFCQLRASVQDFDLDELCFSSPLNRSTLI